MPKLRDLLTEDSLVALQAVTFISPLPEAVDNMTRSDLHHHLAIRTRMGADDAEIFDKCERWAAMRDAHELLKRATR